MIIVVTQEDIDNGTPMCTTLCPIAKAFVRAGVVQPVVRRNIVSTCGRDGNIAVILLPAKAVEFIRAFDHSWPTKRPGPFTFEMPDDTIERLNAVHQPKET